MIKLRRRIILLALAIAAAAPTLARAGQSTERSAVAPAQAAPSSETMELSDSNASRTLSEIISKPRDKVVGYWMTRSSPLDGFRERSSPSEGVTLIFDNAAIRLRLAELVATSHVTWTSLDNMCGWESPMSTTWNSATTSASVPYDAWWPKDPSGARYTVARIETLHPRFLYWRVPVIVTPRDRNGVKDVVGIARPTGVAP